MAIMSTFILAFRAFSLLFAAIELGLTAYVIHYADDYFYEDPYGDWGVNHNTPSQVAFLLFASIWSLLALAYLIVAPIYFITDGETAAHVGRNRTHQYTMMAIDAVTAIFWLAGWIALAKLIGGPSTCSNFCAAIQASVAFAAFLWACFTAAALAEMWRRWKGAGQKVNNRPVEMP